MPPQTTARIGGYVVLGLAGAAAETSGPSQTWLLQALFGVLTAMFGGLITWLVLKQGKSETRIGEGEVADAAMGGRFLVVEARLTYLEGGRIRVEVPLRAETQKQIADEIRDQIKESGLQVQADANTERIDANVARLKKIEAQQKEDDESKKAKP